MSATDELRRLLDERGVEWYETINHVNCVFTWWHSPTFGEVQAMDNEDGETLFMAGLNNCDFTPEQAIAVTLGGGKLTAEQVMTIAGKHQPDYCSDTHVCFDWQAIADDLNAILGGGECGVESKIFIEGEYVPCPYYEYEMECGGQFRWNDVEPPNFCPSCGKAVK